MKQRKTQKQFIVASEIGVWKEKDHKNGYQRGINRAHVSAIAANFDPDRFGVLHVSRRNDGTYWVMDGQHRLAALTQMGESWVNSKIECKVYTGLTIADEARIYYGLNTFVRPLPLNRFNAGLVAGDKDAVAIQKIAERHGYKITSNNQDNALRCSGACEKIFSKSPEALDSALSVASRAWAHPEKPRAAVVSGLGLVFEKYNGAVDQSRLARLLAQKAGTPDVLIGKAQVLRGINGGNLTTNVADVIIGIYNTKMTANRLPLFKG